MALDDPDGRVGEEHRLRVSLPSWVVSTSSFIVDLIFPPRCAGCGRVGEVWCERCVSVVNTVPPLLNLPHPPTLHSAAATGKHIGKLQDAIHALKYENARSIARPLAERMAHVLEHLQWAFDVIVPVPVGDARLRERGYNQAGLIAEALAQEVGVAVQPSLLKRTRETRSQVGLTAEERRQNVSDAFAAHPTLLVQKSILLIDDVYTTGATLGACAEALRAVGAREVFALTVTAAQHQ
jgi:competence protein ComFC